MTREEIHALPWKAQEYINELERNQLKMYTLKVEIDHGHIENIWSGNEMSDAIHYEAIAIKHWGSDAVWICNNMDEITVG